MQLRKRIIKKMISKSLMNEERNTIRSGQTRMTEPKNPLSGIQKFVGKLRMEDLRKEQLISLIEDCFILLDQVKCNCNKYQAHLATFIQKSQQSLKINENSLSNSAEKRCQKC